MKPPCLLVAGDTFELLYAGLSRCTLKAYYSRFWENSELYNSHGKCRVESVTVLPKYERTALKQALSCLWNPTIDITPHFSPLEPYDLQNLKNRLAEIVGSDTSGVFTQHESAEKIVQDISAAASYDELIQKLKLSGVVENEPA